MQNLEELNALVAKQKRIQELQSRTKTIRLVGEWGRHTYLGIEKFENGRYTLGAIEELITPERMAVIVEQFKGLLQVELHAQAQLVDQQLGTFSVNKS